jgi:hypothetical protein
MRLTIEFSTGVTPDLREIMLSSVKMPQSYIRPSAARTHVSARYNWILKQTHRMNLL